MKLLTRSDLYSLEEYSMERSNFRSKVLSHKLNRRVAIGPNASLYFEDRLTVHYQIQEMLRIEKIFEASGISEELDAYNPLIPDGENWKATFMIEFPDAEERRTALTQLVGIEHRVWVKVESEPKVLAFADEDLDRATDEKTSAVHFLRFQLPASSVAAAKSGADISIGIDHSNYSFAVDPLPQNIQDSLVQDLS